jgi:hypothetical protein
VHSFYRQSDKLLGRAASSLHLANDGGSVELPFGYPNGACRRTVLPLAWKAVTTPGGAPGSRPWFRCSRCDDPTEPKELERFGGTCARCPYAVEDACARIAG